jgi:hypothetical protein
VAPFSLYQAVTASRTRLRAVEDEYDCLLKDGSSHLRTAGREYAAAVIAYSNAVMEWLSWFERNAKKMGGG